MVGAAASPNAAMCPEHPEGRWVAPAPSFERIAEFGDLLLVVDVSRGAGKFPERWKKIRMISFVFWRGTKSNRAISDMLCLPA